MRLILISIVLLLGCENAARADTATLLAQSEPAIQDQINRVYNAFQSGDDLRNNVAAFQEVQVLKDSVADKGEIVKQVAIFAAAPGEDRPLMALGILHLLDLPPKNVVRVLAPYLNADNPNLRSFVRDWFQGHDNAAAPGPGLPPLQPVNYDDYKDYARGKLNTNEEVPNAFVEYIYGRSPDRAMLVFYYAHRQRDNDVLLAEHIVTNAIWLKENDFSERFQKALPEAANELATLAKHQEWWARLYVAWIMRQHPELRDRVVMEQLQKDSNALVSKAAKSGKQ
jgi:hypothetical protein